MVPPGVPVIFGLLRAKCPVKAGHTVVLAHDTGVLRSDEVEFGRIKPLEPLGSVATAMTSPAIALGVVLGAKRSSQGRCLLHALLPGHGAKIGEGEASLAALLLQPIALVIAGVVLTLRAAAGARKVGPCIDLKQRRTA